jgi:hypothetical protein
MGFWSSLFGRGFEDGYTGESKHVPNRGLDYTLTSPVGKGPGTSHQLNQENKEYSAGYRAGQEAAEKGK